MSNLVIAMTLILSFNAGAVEPKAGSKELKMPDFSSLNNGVHPGPKVTVEHNCTGQDGRTLKAGEAGYDTCTAAASTSAQKGVKTGQETTTGVSVKLGK